MAMSSLGVVVDYFQVEGWVKDSAEVTFFDRAKSRRDLI